MRRRIKRDYSWNGSSWTQTNEIHFIYDGNLVVQERDINNQPQVTYTRGNDLSGSLQGAGGIGGLLARTVNPSIISPELSAFATTYYHSDGNGNITCMLYPSQTIAAKYLYDAYGNTLSQYGNLADANMYRFSSKEWNGNSELHYYLYRSYDPNLQRWLNRDPKNEFGFRLIGEKKDVQNLSDYPNAYCFCRNTPTDKLDSYGLRDFNVPSGASILTVSGLGTLLEVWALSKGCDKIGPGESAYGDTPASMLSYFSAYMLAAAAFQCNGSPFVIKSMVYKDASGNCHWGGIYVICTCSGNGA
jgi:RHS repeat-associated protein